VRLSPPSLPALLACLPACRAGGAAAKHLQSAQPPAACRFGSPTGAGGLGGGRPAAAVGWRPPCRPRPWQLGWQGDQRTDDGAAASAGRKRPSSEAGGGGARAGRAREDAAADQNRNWRRPGAGRGAPAAALLLV